MKLNKLLEKQIKKFFPENFQAREDFEIFISAVNNSYNAYERDKELSERAFKMTEDEYREINNELKDEVVLKKTLINKLKEAVSEIGEAALIESNDEDEILNIASYLKLQIIKIREAEKKLHDQKQFYEQILNRIPADIAVFDSKHRYLYLNPLAIKDEKLRHWIIGKTDEEYCEFTNKDLSIAAGRRKIFNDTVSSRQQKEWEEKIKGIDGTTGYHLRKMYPVFNEKNELEIVIGYGVDITERKKIEEKIRLSEIRYRGIFDHSLALICTHNLDGIVLDVNKAAIATLGYEQDELVGYPLDKLLPSDKKADFEKNYLSQIKSGGKAEGIMVAISKAGKRIYLLYQNYLVTDDTEETYVIGFSQDITARIDAEIALKKSEEKYRNIIANMNLGLLDVDQDAIIVYANNSFCEMSGYEQDELIGRNANALFPKGDKYITNEKVFNSEKHAEPVAYELPVKNKRGELKWWFISGAPVYNDHGAFKGTIGIHLDITLQKTLEQELRKAKSDTEHSAHTKELFLANMSHEIRTPMNAILGIGRLLGKTELQPQQKLYLKTIQNAADNLLIIINDLLDFSKIEAGKVTLEYIGFDLNAIIENALQVLKHKAEEKGLFLSCYVSQSISKVLLGDPYRINQVLMNLLSNSLKFTENGGVNIECTLVSAEGNYQYILFKVIDTGIGISKEFLGQIFDKFTQEDDSVTRKFGGTGLGMSISKQMIELMGGDIHVESEKNIGTTISFTLKFPRGTSEDLPSNREASAIDIQILKGKKILLVEDNEMNRFLATTILSQYGAEVTEAADGSIAIEKMEQSEFDLILMDVQMPVKDGIETTRHIRAHMDTAIPIIALTANAFKQEQERCTEAGMNDFISKPFDENQMVQLIAEWLGRGSITDSLQNDKPKLNAKLYDLSKLKAISRGNDDFIKKMLELFIEEIPKSLDQMQAAYKNADWKTVGSVAHKIKPSIQNMGITSLVNDIQSIENAGKEKPDPIEIEKLINKVQYILDNIIEQLRISLSAVN